MNILKINKMINLILVISIIYAVFTFVGQQSKLNSFKKDIAYYTTQKENLEKYIHKTKDQDGYKITNEDDFIIDGFTVRRFCDVKKAEIKNDKCVEIIKSEGLLDNIKVPEIDITDWFSVFLSLSELNINIIVEKESLNDDECEFAIGKIVKVLKTKVIFI